MGLPIPFAHGLPPSLPGHRPSPLLLRTCFCVFLCLLVVIFLLRSICDRDPGSIFFQPATAYQRDYSLIRQEQAERYITQSTTNGSVSSGESVSGQEKQLCVGIPSVSREGTRYLRTTVGSLLEGLSPVERRNIHLVVLIAHSDPFANPEYHEPWLANLVDHVLLYEPSQLDHITALEMDVGNREKMLYDYTYTLKTCIDARTPYIAMLEDDVLASVGSGERYSGYNRPTIWSQSRPRSKTTFTCACSIQKNSLGGIAKPGEDIFFGQSSSQWEQLAQLSPLVRSQLPPKSQSQLCYSPWPWLLLLPALYCFSSQLAEQQCLPCLEGSTR